MTRPPTASKRLSQRNLSGYGSLIVSPETGLLTLYWKGAIPAALIALGRSLTSAAITIDIRAADYTEQQLTSAVDTIADSPAAVAAGIATVKPLTDASGIEVDVSKPQFSAQAVTAALPATGVATYVTAGSTPTPIFGRQADTSPFWGGATIVNPSYGEECTSGWPVHFTDNPSGQFLLTANHCGSFGGGDKYYTPANTYIGNQIGQNDLQHDTLMVELDYSNSTAGSAIYTGGVNASGNYNGSGLPISFIEGSGTPEVGDYVCASGAFSGERCLVKITNTDVTSPPNTLYQHMVEAEQTNDTVGVAGQGDSGGPVYTPNEDGSVTALGTLSSIDPGTVVPCTGVQNRLCAWRVYFSNINDAIQYYAISVNGLG